MPRCDGRALALHVADCGPLTVVARLHTVGERRMIELAIGALIIGVIASLLGFTTIAGASFAIAKVIGVIFLMLFLVLVVAAMALF